MSTRRGDVGSPGRARTADLVVNSHPLYQLSYRGMVEESTDATLRIQAGAHKPRAHLLVGRMLVPVSCELPIG